MGLDVEQTYMYVKHILEPLPCALSSPIPNSLCDRILTQLKDMHIQLLSDPEMIAEDFAFYQKKVKGVFFFLGTGNFISLHADIFDFDESVLLEGVALYRRLSMI